jgi:hypothetical protein
MVTLKLDLESGSDLTLVIILKSALFHSSRQQQVCVQTRSLWQGIPSINVTGVMERTGAISNPV